MLWHLHPHGLDVGRTAQEAEAFPQRSRYAVAEGIAVAVQVLDVGIRRYRQVSVVLQQLVMREHERRAVCSVARQHERRCQRVTLQADALGVAKVRCQGDGAHPRGKELEHGDVHVHQPGFGDGDVPVQPMAEASNSRRRAVGSRVSRHDELDREGRSCGAVPTLEGCGDRGPSRVHEQLAMSLELLGLESVRPDERRRPLVANAKGAVRQVETVHC